MSPASLSLRHFLLAIAVVAVWGTNFVVIRIGLDHLPPLFFATLRFVFALLPAVFFLRRPAVSWGNLAAYGFLTGAGQFGALFLAMQGSISPGLASLVIQAQVFFTIGLSVALAGERIRIFQLAALALGAAGIAVIAIHADPSATPIGLALVMLSALSWAMANMAVRSSGTRDMVAYVVWASLFAIPPLLALSLVFEGAPVIWAGVRQSNAGTWGAVLWQAAGNTLFGFAAWGWLLARYPTAVVTPMALLVPVFGMAASAFWLGEPLPIWKLAAAALVLGWLATGLLYPRWKRMRTSGGLGSGSNA